MAEPGTSVAGTGDAGPDAEGPGAAALTTAVYAAPEKNKCTRPRPICVKADSKRNYTLCNLNVDKHDPIVQIIKATAVTDFDSKDDTALNQQCVDMDFIWLTNIGLAEKNINKVLSVSETTTEATVEATAEYSIEPTNPMDFFKKVVELFKNKWFPPPATESATVCTQVNSDLNNALAAAVQAKADTRAAAAKAKPAVEQTDEEKNKKAKEDAALMYTAAVTAAAEYVTQTTAAQSIKQDEVPDYMICAFTYFIDKWKQAFPKQPLAEETPEEVEAESVEPTANEPAPNLTPLNAYQLLHAYRGIISLGRYGLLKKNEVGDTNYYVDVVSKLVAFTSVLDQILGKSTLPTTEFLPNIVQAQPAIGGRYRKPTSIDGRYRKPRTTRGKKKFNKRTIKITSKKMRGGGTPYVYTNTESKYKGKMGFIQGSILGSICSVLAKSVNGVLGAVTGIGTLITLSNLGGMNFVRDHTIYETVRLAYKLLVNAGTALLEMEPDQHRSWAENRATPNDLIAYNMAVILGSSNIKPGQKKDGSGITRTPPVSLKLYMDEGGDPGWRQENIDDPYFSVTEQKTIMIPSDPNLITYYLFPAHTVMPRPPVGHIMQRLNDRTGQLRPRQPKPI